MMYQLSMWLLVRGWTMFIVEPWRVKIAKDIVYIGPIRLIKVR